MVSHNFCIFLISHWWCGLGAESPLRGEIYGMVNDEGFGA